MKINGKTKVSAVIKHNIEAIDTIASINVHFNKLKNPILRAVLAPRVTLSDASRIGKCELSMILNKLADIGFEIEQETQPIMNQISEEKVDVIQIIKFLGHRNCDILDVRPLIEKNEDPFTLIMSLVKELNAKTALEILNSFEPIPLIRILKTKGYESLTIKDEENYRTFIKVGTPQNNPTQSNHTICSSDGFENQLIKYKGNLIEIDVREMEMPLPMVTILQEIGNIKDDNALFVFHKKIPQYLLPELTERGFKTSILEIAEGNVNLLIYK